MRFSLRWLFVGIVLIAIGVVAMCDMVSHQTSRA